MKYMGSEQEIRAGDLVNVEDRKEGIVVCDFDNKEHLSDFEDFGTFLSKGVMVNTEAYGLIHYEFEDDDIEFVEPTDKHN